jgi:hypothetical protein
MATVDATPTLAGPDFGNLSAAQTGNGASTNIADRGGTIGPAIIRVTTTVGATPTCTYLLEGSPDGTNWYPVQYADSATLGTLVQTTFVLTTATTVLKVIQPNQPVRYLRVTYSANTNVTNTTDVITFSTT